MAVHRDHPSRQPGPAEPGGIKVGGHQASCASMVTIMTSLWFGHLRAEDRVSVKPHASPVLHAINYLLGELDESYLTTLREFGGLQSYPSRSRTRPGRLLDRLGRHRRDRTDLGRGGPPLRGQPLPGGPGPGPSVLAAGRRRARRGRGVGGHPRSRRGRARRGRLDRRHEPPVAGPRGAPHHRRPAARHVRRRRLAGHHAEVRPAARGAVRPARRRRAAAPDRRHAQSRVPAAAALRRRRAAPAAARAATRLDRRAHRRASTTRRWPPRSATWAVTT